MSQDDEQLKAKIGQILYNNYITDRLREEVLQRVAHRNSLSLRMSMGRDPSGEEVFLDILVSRGMPEVDKLKKSVNLEQIRAGDTKKFTCILLSNTSDQSVDNASLATNFEYLMSQSLSWWARYSGSRDPLNVENWKILHAITLDSKDAYLASEIPVESVIVPESRRYDVSDIESFAESLETLPPIVVRPKENGRFELVQGYNVFVAYSQAGKADIPAMIRWVDDEEAEALFEQNREAWEKIALKN
ncbi:MAG: ParB/RepB/Spo0J family partition protein [Nitrososphaerales archaeon]